MFLVVIKSHPLAPSWVENDGISDLIEAKRLDEEVQQFLKEYGLYQLCLVQEFESILRRARGLLLLVRNFKFSDENVWNIEHLINQLDEMVMSENFNLYMDVTKVGRRQQVDDLRIQHALSKKNYEAAAKIAMKMLVEDEFVIDTVFVNACTAVNKFFESKKARVPTINANQYLQRETRRAQVNVLREAKNVMFCLDYSGSMADRMER